MFTILTFLFFTALVAILTWRMTRRDDHGSSDGYFLGGRKLTGGFIAGSLLLTNLSTEQLVGLNGAAFLDGFSVMAWEVVAAVGLVLMALFFLPRYLKSGIATIPEFLEKRFDASTRTLTTLIFIIAYAAILLPIILYTGAVGISSIFDIGAVTGFQSDTILWTTVCFVGTIGSLYAIFGGLRTVAVSDTINGLGLLIGGIMIAYFGVRTLGDGDLFQGIEILRTKHPEKLNSIGGPKQSVPFSTLFTGVLLLNLFYWCTNQQIIQRTFGASSLEEGQKGVIYAGYLKVVGPLILVFPGIIAFHLYSTDGIRADQAYGTLVRDVLPPALTGFFAAAMVGAVLSSFNSALNSTCTLFSLGIYKPLLNKNADEATVIRSSKVFGWAIAIIAMLIAPLLAGQESIFGYLQKMNGLYFIPIFSVVVVGMLSRRASAFGAKITLILGFTLISCGYFIPAFDAWIDQNLNDFHFLGLVFVLLVGLMLMMARVSPRETPWVHEDAGIVDLTPWSLAKPAAIVLVLIVVGIYGAFADLSVLH
uniref:Solute:Na+ symporter, SSS family n=1 Tax=Candidatus Kentrum sp. LFY TaxID=2126342 RepID=A0A450VA15_9GAMM|nr:MAG: solute:Na+ symporter, SSS family [Candidatus Kentron sp. LFY]